MYEGTFTTSNGERISVCQMSIGDLWNALLGEIEIVDPSPGETVETARDRLQIELLIRRIDAECTKP